ncbi:MAG: hypothetical protein J6U98_09535 [Abditibacteriota bacterium]|nr:hypothetical protein [Abditibacteriota bacterium]MBP5738971.1 hypothetical protein [Abditibacteriota bacterium]
MKRRKEEPKKPVIPGKVTFSYASESLERQKNYVKKPSKLSVAWRKTKRFFRRMRRWRIPKYVKTTLKDMRRIRAPKIKPIKIRMTSKDVIIVTGIAVIIMAFLVFMVYKYYRVEYRPYWW